MHCHQTVSFLLLRVFKKGVTFEFVLIIHMCCTGTEYADIGPEISRTNNVQSEVFRVVV